MWRGSRGGERGLEPVGRRQPTRRDAGVRARLKSHLAGRWSLIRAAEDSNAASSDHTRDLAMALLERHGILTREMLGVESAHISWSEISFALRRLEYGRTNRRGSVRLFL